MQYTHEESKDGVFFECPIPQNLKETDHIFFAYTYPYNINDINYSIKDIEDKSSAYSSRIHYERIKIGESLEGRDIELLTLSSK